MILKTQMSEFLCIKSLDFLLKLWNKVLSFGKISASSSFDFENVVRKRNKFETCWKQNRKTTTNLATTKGPSKGPATWKSEGAAPGAPGTKEGGTHPRLASEL